VSEFPDDMRLHALAFRESPVASFLTDLQGAVTAWNGAAEALLGWAAREVLGRPFPGEDTRVGPVAELVRAAAAGVKPPPRDLTVQQRSGLPRELRFESCPLRGMDGAPLGAAVHFRDLGPSRAYPERPAAELALLQDILDAIPVPVFQKDASGVYRACNKAFAEYLGRTRDEILGKGVEAVAPPALASVYRAADRALVAAGGTQVYEARVRYADGTLHDVLFNKAALRDGQGRIAGLVGSMLDLTERKRAEEALLLNEHRLELRGRLAAVDTLAAGVGHEINNPLAALVSSLNFIRSRLDQAADREVAEALGDAMDAAARVSRVVRDLRGFSRLEDELAPVDLAEVLRSTVSLARSEIERRARLILEVGALPLVLGNGPRLGQVFLSLLVHAAQSMPARLRDENEVRVTARSEEDRVCVEVRDNGVGIPPSVQARIFDPFFATTEQGTGSGLGLAICYRVVTGLGGEVEVQSQEGSGSVFRVLLPVVEEEDQAIGSVS